jgi:hypothetical protein
MDRCSHVNKRGLLPARVAEWHDRLREPVLELSAEFRSGCVTLDVFEVIADNQVRPHAVPVTSAQRLAGRCRFDFGE